MGASICLRNKPVPLDVMAVLVGERPACLPACLLDGSRHPRPNMSATRTDRCCSPASLRFSAIFQSPPVLADSTPRRRPPVSCSSHPLHGLHLQVTRRIVAAANGVYPDQ